MKRLFLALLTTILLAGCAVVPVGYGRYGVVLNGGYGNSGHGHGYGWGRSTRWIPGYQRWVCEGPPPNTRCYWAWEPAHYE